MRRADVDAPPLPPASQEVVPHSLAFCSWDAGCSGFAALRLRQGRSTSPRRRGRRSQAQRVAASCNRAQPSAERSEARAGCFRLRQPQLCGITSSDGSAWFAGLMRRADVDAPPLPPASQEVVPNSLAFCSWDAGCSGFAALRLRQGWSKSRRCAADVQRCAADAASRSRVRSAAKHEQGASGFANLSCVASLPVMAGHGSQG
jgi:hypothetical protein